MIISRWIFLRMGNVSCKVVGKIETTQIVHPITFCCKSCRLWDNVEKYGRSRQATSDNIKRRIRYACWINKATETHSKHVILIAFSIQQLLGESSWMLRYTYSLSCSSLCFISRKDVDSKKLRQYVQCALKGAACKLERNNRCDSAEAAAHCINP